MAAIEGAVCRGGVEDNRIGEEREEKWRDEVETSSRQQSHVIVPSSYQTRSHGPTRQTPHTKGTTSCELTSFERHWEAFKHSYYTFAHWIVEAKAPCEISAPKH